jgi:alcohol dehydrogenase
MTLTLPAPVTAATAMDALSHAVEACLCLGRNPLSTAHAHEAIALISHHLLPVIRQPDQKPGRLALATGAALAGMAFSNSMVGMVHTLGHAVGSVCHAAHGTCMAVLLPYGMAYNLHKTQHLLADLLLPMAGADVYAMTHPAERAQKAIDWVDRMNRQLHQATGGAHAFCLRDIKNQDGKSCVPRHLLPKIAHTALGDGSIFYNPEDLDYDDCLMVLEAAFDGASLNMSRVKKG